MSLRGKVNVGAKIFPDSRKFASVNGAAPTDWDASSRVDTAGLGGRLSECANACGQYRQSVVHYRGSGEAMRGDQGNYTRIC